MIGGAAGTRTGLKRGLAVTAIARNVLSESWKCLGNRFSNPSATSWLNPYRRYPRGFKFSSMRNLPFISIDHVQLAMPVGEEDKARTFYRDLLGMVEIPKPTELAKRGGCWFESGGVQIHLGVENDFRPAKKAHPALRCRDYQALVEQLRNAGVEVTEPGDIPDVMRCHIHDPFGNRIELIG
jgi:catechol 2,3-dioxygenase-like lactoylglutathione lyase family enzyme